MRESKTSIYIDDISGRSLVRRTGLVFFSNLTKCIKNQKETLKNELEKKFQIKNDKYVVRAFLKDITGYILHNKLQRQNSFNSSVAGLRMKSR
jgi:hypothetical protein